MTIRIIREDELRDVLRGNEVIAKDREYVLNELEALREYILWPASKREWADGPTEKRGAYALELITEIKKAVESSWLPPVTAADLKEDA